MKICSTLLFIADMKIKLQWHIIILIRMSKRKEKVITQNTGKDLEKLDYSNIANGK